ncbi:hypothetical protein ACWEVP_31815 [Amycolatopsis sp. NPDC003865]
MSEQDGKWYCVEYWREDGVKDTESFETRYARARWLESATEDIIRVYETRWDV